MEIERGYPEGEVGGFTVSAGVVRWVVLWFVGCVGGSGMHGLDGFGWGGMDGWI